METRHDLSATIQENWRKDAWRQIKGAVTWYLCLGAAIALITLEDVATNSSVHSVIQYVERVIPSLPKFVAISDFPGLTAFYFAAMWIVLPVPIVMTVAKWPSPPSPSLRQSAIPIFLAPVVVATILAILYVLPLPEHFSCPTDVAGGSHFSL